MTLPEETVIELTPEEMESLIDAEVDAVRRRYASLMARTLIYMLVPVIVVILGIWAFAPEYPQILLYGLAVSSLLPIALMHNPLIKRGQYVLWVTIILGTITGIFFLSPLLMATVLPGTAVGYVLVFALAYQLLGNRASSIFAVVLLVAMTVDYVLVVSYADTWFPQPDETLETLFGIGISTVTLGCVIVLVRPMFVTQSQQFRTAFAMNLKLETQVMRESYQREALEQAQDEVERRASGEQAQREQLQVLVDKVTSLINNLNMTADEIMAASTQQLASASEQDAAVNQTVATVDEAQSTAQQVADSMQSVKQATEQSVDVSQRGQVVITEITGGMMTLRKRVEDIADTVLQLSERTQQIGEIVAAVNGLADQSKLLALNASIEAARAGTEGRGFAVVAMEVRQLAEQSREATGRIGQILGDIQDVTNTAVMVTEAGSKDAERGVELVAEAGDAIRELADVIDLVMDSASQIATSTQQQTTGMDQLALAMRQIQVATQQTASSARQSESSARGLMDMARELEETTSQ